MSNTENTITEKLMSGFNNKNRDENTKQTLLNNYTIFGEYNNKELLYPNNELEKWKRRLKIIRTKTDNKCKINHLPFRRPANNEPLHKVFKDIMNRDELSISDDVKDTTQYPKWQVNSFKLRDIVSPYTLDLLKEFSKDAHKKNVISNEMRRKTQQTISPSDKKIKTVYDKTNDCQKFDEPPNVQKTDQIIVKGASRNYMKCSSPRKDFKIKTNIAQNKNTRFRSLKESSVKPNCDSGYFIKTKK